MLYKYVYLIIIKKRKNQKMKKKAKKVAPVLETKATTNGKKVDSASSNKVKDKVTKKPELTGKNKEKVKAATAEATVKKITAEKDLKYIYPDKCSQLDKRKLFRAEVRRKTKAFIKKIVTLQDSNLKEDKVLLAERVKEFQNYAKSVYVEPETVTETVI